MFLIKDMRVSPIHIQRIENIIYLKADIIWMLWEKSENINSWKEENGIMIKISTTESKTTPAKKNIQLKNISIKDLKIVDTDTGEDITEQVIDEIPDGVDVCDFKLTFELPDEV